MEYRPPLKWAGGKRWLVPYLEPMWRPYKQRRFVELMCGGLGVALSLRPERALLNDLNPHLINFYRWLQRGLEISIEMVNDSVLYYRHRDRYNELITNGGADSREAAELMYYLNRTCWNGLTRYNRKGQFNVPIGRYDVVVYQRDFRRYAEALAGWQFTNCDFADVPLAPDDFIYADPPYDVEFTRYTPHEFRWDEQVRLAKHLATHPGPVVISNQRTDRIVELYTELGFEVRELETWRSIAADGSRRGTTVEVLAFKHCEFRQDAQLLLLDADEAGVLKLG